MLGWQFNCHPNLAECFLSIVKPRIARMMHSFAATIITAGKASCKNPVDCFPSFQLMHKNHVVLRNSQAGAGKLAVVSDVA